ncbi:MAG: FG-GAP-like repeat-containing protein [Gemmatimonadota bacterium]
MVIVGACADPQVTAPTCETDPSLCPDPGPNTTAQYISDLPSWESFAAPDTVQRNELDAAADTLPLVETFVDSVPQFDSTGVTGYDVDVRYVCQERPYSISDAPEKIIMFSPNQSILYAGALIQGRSKKELGSLLPLSIAERAPIDVVIADLPTGQNSRTVVPTLATVSGARGEMIGDAVLNELGTPSSSTFELNTYHSEQAFALSANLSGRYLAFEASASGSVNRKQATTTVTAHYFEKMYTVSVERPVGGFFSDDFTNAALDGYVADGVIGPDNLPVYVSEIVYGRMMMFSVTSTASESDIRAAMQASYNSFTGSASGGVSTRQEALLSESEITITAVGGSGEAASAMIVSGDWSAYFQESAELDTAVPLSYTFSNVGDGSIAAVTESTDYTISECQPKPLIPGTFDFNNRLELATGITPGYDTRFGDVNGDGFQDMIFTYTSVNTNEIAVALGDANGGFSVQSAEDSSIDPPEGWSLYDDVVVGDFNDDGNDDIAWNKLETDDNTFYVGLSDGDGTFTWLAGQQKEGTGNWPIFSVHVADLDNQNGDDLIWHGRSGSMNKTWVAMSNGDGTFVLDANAQDQVGTANWNGTDFAIADVTGDGFVDLIHSRTIESGNANWVSRSNGDGTFDMSDGAFTVYGGSGWADYKFLTGDMDGDQRTDLIFVADARSRLPIHRAIARANGTFAPQSWHDVPSRASGEGPYQLRTGDVDGDGDDDIIMVDLDSSNNAEVLTNRVLIWVGLGTDDALGKRFDFTPVDQLHPAQEVWGQYDVEVRDLNGDNKADLVLHWASSPHQVFVALAK